MNPYRHRILNKIDLMASYTEKLEYLNNRYLRAKTREEENTILSMIEQLKQWGK